jgi:hypothetical protein
MPKLPFPSSTIAHPKGAPPPQWCPRCLSAEPPENRRRCGWLPVPGNLPDYYRARGWQALVMCSGCGYILAQEVDA